MFRRIDIQFIFIAGLITAIVMLVFAWTLIRSQKEKLLDDKIQYANQLSETIKKSTLNDMMANTLDDVYLIIRTIGEQEGIDKVRIFEKTGAVLYSTREEEIGTAVDMQAEACFACHASDQPITHVDIPDRTRIFSKAGGARLLGIINPIYNEPGCSTSDCHYHDPDQRVLGVLDITMGLDDVDLALQQMRNKTLAMVLFAFLGMGLLTYLFVRWRILIPVRRLAEGCARVAAGDLHLSVKARQSDEIGVLTRSFNEMVAKLNEAQLQISQSDKLASVGRLAAGVAHEINNPMTAVLSYTSLLLNQADRVEKEQLKKDLEVVVRETKRCRRIVRGLLDFARQTPFTLARTDVNSVVIRSVEVLANQMNLSHIALTKELAQGLPPIQADPNQLQQVIVNLLVNAMDAIPGKGEIRVVTRAPDASTVEIRVEDDGVGIEPERLGRIFEPFHTTKGQSGTGLGLAVSWGIVSRHKGDIRVESVLGKGAVFTISLPVQAEEAP